MTAVARGQRAIIRLMQDDPEASYSADDLGGEGAALTGLVIAGKITKSGRGSAARYMLAEDVAVEEQPDEVVPVPPEEEEEVEEVVVPRDHKLSVAAAKMWVRAANTPNAVLQVNASGLNSRYPMPPDGYDRKLNFPKRRSKRAPRKKPASSKGAAKKKPALGRGRKRSCSKKKKQYYESSDDDEEEDEEQPQYELDDEED